MNFVPPKEVRDMLRLAAGLVYGKMLLVIWFFLHTAAMEGTRLAKEAGTSQSYTLGWFICNCSPAIDKGRT